MSFARDFLVGTVFCHGNGIAAEAPLPISAPGDKVEHMLAFSVLALLVGLALPVMPLPPVAGRGHFSPR
ncbi:hypothetical protein QH494_11925 [Sphingomonas sp. AR_OL41]|uniref:hypothetical protein n=1 Tax=Sphingomonas sp. AR_OL41 TaxID=3042729 RepID=UPI00248180DC|nr:hypothetical protein [Sphingomonas sp. AR_OL41]MDH7972895.1 hypothetical protein [Sphingomonas sp. AR_OL41]